MELFQRLKYVKVIVLEYVSISSLLYSDFLWYFHILYPQSRQFWGVLH